MTSWPDPKHDTLMRKKTGELRKWAIATARVRGLLNDFVYMNYADDRQTVYGDSTGPENLRKLMTIRDKYDQNGVFSDLWHGGFKLPRSTDSVGPLNQQPLTNEL
jgi:hypothetical protein